MCPFHGAMFAKSNRHASIVRDGELCIREWRACSIAAQAFAPGLVATRDGDVCVD
jgi:hypothetical protein